MIGGETYPLLQGTDRLLIGAFSENAQCCFNEEESFRAATPFLQDLNVSGQCWKTDSREFKLSAGQFVTLEAGGILMRVDGVPLKTAILDKWKAYKDLSLVSRPWGLELSLCTSSARRVPLKDLFRGGILQFATTYVAWNSNWYFVCADCLDVDSPMSSFTKSIFPRR
jgi:hypothetical protein